MRPSSVSSFVPLGGYVKIIGMFPPETDREQQISRGEQVPADTAAAPAYQEAHSDVLVAASTATPDAPLTLHKSNTGLFATDGLADPGGGVRARRTRRR